MYLTNSRLNGSFFQRPTKTNNVKNIQVPHYWSLSIVIDQNSTKMLICR